MLSETVLEIARLMQDWSDRILYRTGGLNMDKNYIIETKILQSSTAHKRVWLT